MNVLLEIIRNKETEITDRKKNFPLSRLERMPAFKSKTRSLRNVLTYPDRPGIIAEFKRRSPSNPSINLHADILTVCKGYVQSGAVALSVLTDEKYFGGKPEDLLQVREAVQVPVLRKDFIVDEYQLYEARAFGADAVLLIAAALPPDKLKALVKQAHQLGLETVLEVHSREEWERYGDSEADVVGVNNRDLKTLKTDVRISMELAAHFPDGVVRISESGIRNVATAVDLIGLGYCGFLIGEFFMEQPDPAFACGNFIKAIKNQQHVA